VVKDSMTEHDKDLTVCIYIRKI